MQTCLFSSHFWTKISYVFISLYYVTSPLIWPFYIQHLGIRDSNLDHFEFDVYVKILRSFIRGWKALHEFNIILCNRSIRFKDFTMITMRISLLGCHVMQFDVTCESKRCHTPYYSLHSQKTEIKKKCYSLISQVQGQEAPKLRMRMC